MIDDPRLAMESRQPEPPGNDRTTLVLAGIAAVAFLAGLLTVFSTNDQRGTPSVAETPRTEAPAQPTAPAPNNPAPESSGRSQE